MVFFYPKFNNLPNQSNVRRALIVESCNFCKMLKHYLLRSLSSGGLKEFFFVHKSNKLTNKCFEIGPLYHPIGRKSPLQPDTGRTTLQNQCESLRWLGKTSQLDNFWECIHISWGCPRTPGWATTRMIMTHDSRVSNYQDDHDSWLQAEQLPGWSWLMTPGWATTRMIMTHDSSIILNDSVLMSPVLPLWLEALKLSLVFHS